MTTPLHRIANFARALFDPSPVSRIGGWKLRTATPQPRPDVDTAVVLIEAMIDRHADAGSLDEAHGAVLDRLIVSWCTQWREGANRHHLQQDRELSEIRDHGAQDLVTLGRELEEHRAEAARHQRFVDARWDHLTSAERDHLEEHAVAAPEVPALPLVDGHRLLELPGSPTTPGEPLPPPTEIEEYRRNNHFQNDDQPHEGAS